MNGIKTFNGATSRFWMQHNHPIELSSNDLLQQRLDYLHYNPVVAGFVEKPEDWLWSSAGDYCQVKKGQIELVFIE